ncbi:MAG: dienelactone hydrolase family protein [Betaproteobacteria bacterium]
MARRALPFLAAVVFALAGASAHAAWVEKIIKVPVKVTNAYGKVIEQEVVVSVYHDSDAAQPYPIALINHGRAAKADERAAFGRATSITNARWLAAMGFLVVVPTRIGYGVSGGEDVEDTGDCGRKNYPPGYEAAASQTLQVLDVIKQRPDVAPNRTLILGQSFGGATAIAVAAKNPPGVLAAINFAGGGGGNPVTHPQEPCGTSQLRRMFADYGRRARIPTLWIYTENDQWMGSKYPREWFAAFQAEGGVGEFVQFPPHGKDGHGLFSQAPEVWRPTVLTFLQANGFADLTVKAQAPR